MVHRSGLGGALTVVVLVGGCGGATTTSEAGGGGDANLPYSLPREAALAGVRSVADAVAACGSGQHGTAITTITVSGATGRVTGAQVTGQFAGTPVGSCIARAVRDARFPRFRRDTFQVSYPYRI